MEPDKYQQAWQTNSSQPRVKVDADLLRKAVQRNQQDFRSKILGRDIGEVGVGLLLLPYWIYKGLIDSMPWTWWLGVPAIIWVVGFFLVDRWRHPQTPSNPGEPLLKCVKNSLSQVEHQIWLLRNIFWWYLLPFTIALLAFFAHVALQTAAATNDWLDALAFGASLFIFVFALYGFIFYINQRAVRTDLEPRRQQLLALLASLHDEATTEVSGEYPILMGEKRNECSPRRKFVSIALLLIGVLGLFIGMSFFKSTLGGYAKLSPFAAVRWQQSEPEIKVDDEWFKLMSLDGIAVAEIVAFSQRTYGDKWRKRFEEDLVELLAEMGHPPHNTVTLVVQSLTSPQTRTFENVPMTRSNRRAIRDANGIDVPPQKKRKSIEVPLGTLKSYEGVYAITPQFALTATVEDGKLMVQATGQQKFEVYAASPTEFYYTVVDAQLTFVPAPGGKCERVILHQNGQDMAAERN